MASNATPSPRGRVSVRQSPGNPNRWVFDFDPAAPGGRGGASVWLDPNQGLASIDGVHKNGNLPPRSTGELLADGFRQTHLPRPAILEAFNVEQTTAAVLRAGGTGPGTRIGNMLADTAACLGGFVSRWEPIPDGTSWHLRAHVSYP